VRCLPYVITPSGGFVGGPSIGGSWADAACTKPLVTIEAAKTGCPTALPKYATLAQSTCPTPGISIEFGRLLFALGPNVRPSNVYIGGPDGCHADPNPPPDDYYEVDLNDVVSPSEFTAATLVVVP